MPTAKRTNGFFFIMKGEGQEVAEEKKLQLTEWQMHTRDSFQKARERNGRVFFFFFLNEPSS